MLSDTIQKYSIIYYLVVDLIFVLIAIQTGVLDIWVL